MRGVARVALRISLSIKVEFRAEHGGSDECGYAERKRDNREGHGFDHETLPLVLSGDPRLLEAACKDPAVGYVISITLWSIPRPHPWPLRGAWRSTDFLHFRAC